MWNLKCKIIAVINGATGIVTRGLRKKFQTITEKHSVDSLQKTAVLGTSHIMQKVLQSENGSLCGGNRRWFRRHGRKKRRVSRDMMMVIIIIIIISPPELPFSLSVSF